MTTIETLTRNQLIDRVRGLLAHISTVEAERDSLVRDKQCLREQVSQLSSLVQLSLRAA